MEKKITETLNDDDFMAHTKAHTDNHNHDVNE